MLNIIVKKTIDSFFIFVAPPSIGLPPACPAFLDGKNEILRVTEYNDMAWFFEGFEAGDGGEDFHPIVGGFAESSRQLLSMGIVEQHNSVSTRTRVANTAAIRIYVHPLGLFGQFIQKLKKTSRGFTF